MNKFAAVTLSALTAFGALAPVATTEALARHRGRNVAIGAGVILGAAALAAAANSAQAREYRGGRYAHQCRKWRWQCEDGSDWACAQFDRRC